MFIFERECSNREGHREEGYRGSEVGFALTAVSPGDVGLELMNHEIMT